MSDVARTPEVVAEDRRARLRKRLTGGAFTALVAVEWATAQLAGAAAPLTGPSTDDMPAPSTIAAAGVSERADAVRDALARRASDETKPGEAPLWGNGWYNWNNNWHNWHNNWNNWQNNWNNWNNNWNNWSNNWNNWSNNWNNVTPWSNWKNGIWVNI